MKQIETIKSGKNFTAVTAGTFAEIIEHELPMGPDFTLKGKVFLGQALGATGAELSYQTLVPGQDSGFLHTHKTMLCIQYKANAFTDADSPMTDGNILNEPLNW